MKIYTIESEYEYRLKRILKLAFDEISKKDVGLDTVSPEMFFDLLEDNSKTLGKALIEDMIEWMSEEDWLNLLRGN